MKPVLLVRGVANGTVEPSDWKITEIWMSEMQLLGSNVIDGRYAVTEPGF